MPFSPAPRVWCFVQVYTGYFWFCVMYFFLALVVTQIMMRFPPLGQPRSTWVAWAKVRYCFLSDVPVLAVTPEIGALTCSQSKFVVLNDPHNLYVALFMDNTARMGPCHMQDRTWLSLIGFTSGVLVSIANVLQFLGGQAAGKLSLLMRCDGKSNVMPSRELCRLSSSAALYVVSCLRGLTCGTPSIRRRPPSE